MRNLLLATAIVAASTTASLADSTPKPGGTLIVGRQNQAQCIDPQQDNYGYGSFDGRELVDSLTDQGYDDPTKFAPWLAESWEVNKDATSAIVPRFSVSVCRVRSEPSRLR